jgi:hypothetical protein
MEVETAAAGRSPRPDRPVRQRRAGDAGDDVRDIQDETGLVHGQVDVVRGVDGAHDEVGVPGDLDDRARIAHPVVEGDDLGLRRIGLRPVPCRINLFPADRRGTVEELPGQVAGLDDVQVGQGHPPDTEPEQRLQHPGAEPTHAEQEDVRARRSPMDVGAAAFEIRKRS